jgi:hypothetical protein
MGQPPATTDKRPVDRNRLLILIGGTVIVGIVLLLLAYFLLVRQSGSAPAPPPAATPSLADVENTGEAIQGGACEQLITAMAVNDLPIEVSVRLQELAKNENAAGNSTYFANIGTQLTPTRDSYQDACLADIASGKEPATVRSFVTAFDTAVEQGASIGAQVAATNRVDPAQAQALTEAATQLEQANAALPEAPSSDVSTNGAAALVPIPDEPPAQGDAAALAALSLPANPVDPFAPGTPTPVGPATGTPTPDDPYGLSLNPTAPAVIPMTPTPAPSADAALAASDNAIDQSRAGSVPNANK